MSWISEFAGKAENLLNKLDNNAATLLNNEKKRKKKKSSNDQQEVEPLTSVNVYRNPPPETEPVEHGLSSYASSSRLLENEAACVQNKPVNDENEMLKNEIRGLNAEINLLFSRVKLSENEAKDLKITLSNKAKEEESHVKEIQLLKQKLAFVEKNESQLSSSENKLENEELQSKLSVFQAEALKREEALKNDLLEEQLRVAEIEETLGRARKECKKELAEMKTRVDEAERELAEYKTRARKTLEDKERLIEKLKNNSGEAVEEEPSREQLELRQLKLELENLSNELEKSEGRAEAARKREEEVERLLEAAREDLSAEATCRINQLSQETSRRKIAEENVRRHAEELLRIREDLTRQTVLANERARNRDGEISRLRQQLSQCQQDQFPADSSRSVNNHQTRITSLAQALVQKQAALEEVTNDRNQLRLQLERVKTNYSQYAEHNGRSTNDTDDAKAQVPGFMMETPFDTHVTRRVKRVYSSLNALSFRSGAFFRRRPIARMLLLFYGVVLHLWVCFILFSSTPDTKL